jgi:hypothetical protein
LNHHASPAFWECYRSLPAEIRDLADKSFELLKADSRHPSLHFKKVGEYRSARVGLHYRALGVDIEDGILWFWIGNHGDYDRIVR